MRATACRQVDAVPAVIFYLLSIQSSVQVATPAHRGGCSGARHKPDQRLLCAGSYTQPTTLTCRGALPASHTSAIRQEADLSQTAAMQRKTARAAFSAILQLAFSTRISDRFLPESQNP